MPKHGRWLSLAEIELAVLARQYLSKRIATPATRIRKVTTSFVAHNARRCPVTWRFTTANAGLNLLRLYPALHG